MPKAKTYPPSWIDEEKFSRPAFRFLREIVVLYQTKEELVKYLNESDWGNGDKPGERTKEEIRNWLFAAEVLLLREKNLKLEREIRHIRFPPMPPKKEYDEKRFNRFKKSFIKICETQRVYVYANYNGDIAVRNEDYDEDSKPSFYLENEILAPTKTEE
jgi:hypothetical protein